MKPICIAVMLLACLPAFALKPLRDYVATPMDYGMPYQAHPLVLPGVTLQSWHIAQKKSSARPTVLMAGSDYGNMSYALGVARIFYDCGYNVILFDYRGFGESSAVPLDSNRLFYEEFADDLISVYRYYLKKAEPPPVIFGSSMGTIVATVANARDGGQLGSGFIFDSFVGATTPYAAQIAKAKGRPIYSTMGDEEYQRAVELLRGRKALFFDGTQDAFCHPFQPQPKAGDAHWRIVPFEGGHMQAPYQIPERFAKEVAAF